MNKILLLLVGCLGCMKLANAQTVMPMEHEHKMVQMPTAALEPKLYIQLNQDEKSGFNLVINTENFQLEPPEEGDNAPDNLLEGHAHIYINGEKIYRAYGRYTHLPGSLFKPGVNQIMVSLNDHDHNTWSRGARMVMSTLVIDTSKPEFLQHEFSTFGLTSR
ncbi:hypothetical protein [Ketobacter alkanivorans]|uniref:Uncharacterized protein n=1 Tax=Ketobacter alkanivorans TaxID=1917421 RepID=A0A2K9LTX6_9GAMM|nr:hypothetical protein [Ketobacter alkanivorans]AUM14274.1 hypothetical protein Kalk_18405 [Ketobacter alkanivorans]